MYCYTPSLLVVPYSVRTPYYDLLLCTQPVPSGTPVLQKIPALWMLQKTPGLIKHSPTPPAVSLLKIPRTQPRISFGDIPPVQLIVTTSGNVPPGNLMPTATLYLRYTPCIGMYNQSARL